MIDHYYKMSHKLQLHDETIQPWQADESSMANLILFSAEKLKQHSHYLPKNHHKLSSHPPQPQTSQPPAKPFVYRKDRNEVSSTKVKGQIIDNNDSFVSNTLVKSVMENRSAQIESEAFSVTLQPINWSAMMCLDQPHRKKHLREAHQDNAVIRLYSQKDKHVRQKDKQKQRNMSVSSREGPHEDNHFQKMLKLKDSIRKRKVKSYNKSIFVENAEETPRKAAPQLHTRLFLKTSDEAKRQFRPESQLLMRRGHDYSSQRSRNPVFNLLKIDDKTFRIEQN